MYVIGKKKNIDRIDNVLHEHGGLHHLLVLASHLQLITSFVILSFLDVGILILVPQDLLMNFSLNMLNSL